MIVVVCLNPALDITHHVAAVERGGVNRPAAVHDRPGGKGLNVARTLAELEALAGRPLAVAAVDGGAAGPDRAAGADLAAVAGAARELRVTAAQAVVVTLGPGGLLAVTEDGCWRARPPAAVAGNATGAGGAVTVEQVPVEIPAQTPAGGVR